MNDRLSSTSEDPLYDPHELRGMISKDNQMDIYKVWYMQLNEIGMKAIPEKNTYRGFYGTHSSHTILEFLKSYFTNPHYTYIL